MHTLITENMFWLNVFIYIYLVLGKFSFVDMFSMFHVLLSVEKNIMGLCVSICACECAFLAKRNTYKNVKRIQRKFAMSHLIRKCFHIRWKPEHHFWYLYACLWQDVAEKCNEWLICWPSNKSECICLRILTQNNWIEVEHKKIGKYFPMSMNYYLNLICLIFLLLQFSVEYLMLTCPMSFKYPKIDAVVSNIQSGASIVCCDFEVNRGNFETKLQMLLFLILVTPLSIVPAHFTLLAFTQLMCADDVEQQNFMLLMCSMLDACFIIFHIVNISNPMWMMCLSLLLKWCVIVNGLNASFKTNCYWIDDMNYQPKSIKRIFNRILILIDITFPFWPIVFLLVLVVFYFVSYGFYISTGLDPFPIVAMEHM